MVTLVGRHFISTFGGKLDCGATKAQMASKTDFSKRDDRSFRMSKQVFVSHFEPFFKMGCFRAKNKLQKGSKRHSPKVNLDHLGCLCHFYRLIWSPHSSIPSGLGADPYEPYPSMCFVCHSLVPVGR